MAQRLANLHEAIGKLQGGRRYGLSVLLGILTALALAPYYIWPTLVLGFTGLVWLIDGVAQTKGRLRKGFFVGWCFGFGYFLAGIYWLGFAFLVQAEEFAWMAPFAILGMPAFLALFVGGFTALAVRFWHQGYGRVLILVVCLSACEYIRGHILTGFPWNLTGQAFAGTALTAQLASFIGPYGLSLVVMLLAVLPAALIATEKTGWKPLYALAAGMAAILIIGALRMMTPVGINNQIQIVTVQPNIFQRDKIDPDKQIDNFRKVMAVTAEKFTDGSVTAPIVYVAWPENAVPLLAERPGYLDAIANFLPPNAILLTGSVRRDEIGGKLRYYNSMLVVADVSATMQPDLPAQAIEAGLFRQRAAIASYDKTHLAPFGEYLPLAGLLRAVGLAQLAPFDEGFTPGTGPQTLDLGATKMAPNICYETVFPGTLYPKSDRPDWLLTVTNDAWFGDNAGPKQHLDQARLRAIETGLPFFRSANTGISAAIDPYGRVLKSVPLYQEGAIVAALPMAAPPPLYTKLDDFPYGLLLLGLGYGGLRTRRVL